MSRRQRRSARAFAAQTLCFAVAVLFLALAALPTVGPHLHVNGRNAPYVSIACVDAHGCALPDLPRHARHQRVPQLAVRRTETHVRRGAVAAQPMAVAAPAELLWAAPARWRHVDRDVHPEQPLALTRSGRSPPVA
jgi:hypothetical protein